MASPQVVRTYLYSFFVITALATGLAYQLVFDDQVVRTQGVPHAIPHSPSSTDPSQAPFLPTNPIESPLHGFFYLSMILTLLGMAASLRRVWQGADETLQERPEDQRLLAHKDRYTFSKGQTYPHSARTHHTSPVAHKKAS